MIVILERPRPYAMCGRGFSVKKRRRLVMPGRANRMHFVSSTSLTLVPQIAMRLLGPHTI